MRFEETLEYLYAQLPMFQRIGRKAMKTGLGNILQLMEILDHPHDKFKSIHIAGTNGKGSTAHFIAACLQAAGYRVGLYSSPHYKDFRERIKINGKLIPKREVTKFILRFREKYAVLEPSFFEITVAMAFDYFARQNVDLAVVETGLGGRLDSTNVVTPLLSVITNINYDHTDVLGDTLSKIAFEKAGIIKQGIPVVIGEYHKETAVIFKDVADKLKAPVSFADLNLVMESLVHNLDFQEFNVLGKNGVYDLPNISIPTGALYQLENVRTALWALNILSRNFQEFKVGKTAIRKGLSDFARGTHFLGRWQILETEPLIICDSAHNVHGLVEVTDALKLLKGGKLHLVLGFVKEKDHRQFLSLFPEGAKYYICRPNVPRGANVEDILRITTEMDLMAKGYSSVRRALSVAKKNANGDDLIFVGGSSFVVAEAI